MFSKGQASMEYLMIIGFTLVLVIPLLLVFNSTWRDQQGDLAVSQMSNVADEIIQAANEVNALGESSQKILNVYFPENVHGLHVIDNTPPFDTYKILAVNISLGEQNTYILRSGEPQLEILGFENNDDAYPGQHRIRIWADDVGKVSIEEAD